MVYFPLGVTVVPILGEFISCCEGKINEAELCALLWLGPRIKPRFNLSDSKFSGILLDILSLRGLLTGSELLLEMMFCGSPSARGLSVSGCTCYFANGTIMSILSFWETFTSSLKFYCAFLKFTIHVYLSGVWKALTFGSISCENLLFYMFGLFKLKFGVIGFFLSALFSNSTWVTEFFVVSYLIDISTSPMIDSQNFLFRH